MIPGAQEGVANVKNFGAKADGQADDTAAIQKALDSLAPQRGGTVYLPPGRYLVTGSLAIPTGVALVGANQSYQTATLVLALAGQR